MTDKYEEFQKEPVKSYPESEKKTPIEEYVVERIRKLEKENEELRDALSKQETLAHRFYTYLRTVFKAFGTELIVHKDDPVRFFHATVPFVGGDDEDFQTVYSAFKETCPDAFLP